MSKVQTQDVFRGFLIAALCGSLMTGCTSKSSGPTGPGGGTGGTITVSGTVIGANNQPQSGVPVIIIGTTIPSVNTDASGKFTISNVTTPYNIAVVDAASKRSLVYKGLTRSDPTLVWLGLSPGVAHNASLTGTIYPSSSYPEPLTGRRSRVAFASPEAASGTNVNGTTGTYAVGATWYGSTTTTGTVYALQWNYDGSGIPSSYQGFGMRSGITLLDATTNPNGNDTMSAVSSATLSGTVTVASGYTLAQKSLSVVFANKGSISLLSDNSAAAVFSYTAPSITGASMYLTAVSTKSTGTSVAFKLGLAPNATGVALSVPAAPELSLPVNATTGVTKSNLFSWTPVPNAVHLVLFNGPGGQPSYLVLTAAAADSIPDMSAAGLGLPASTSYTWYVYSFGPLGSTDAAAGSSGFLGALVGLPLGDGFYGFSANRTFTTAP